MIIKSKFAHRLRKKKVNYFLSLFLIMCNSFENAISIPEKIDLGQPGCCFPPFG
jgi:hypothetical protein